MQLSNTTQNYDIALDIIYGAFTRINSLVAE